MSEHGFGDTSFSENLTKPIHSWTPWIGGFSAEFVRGLIGRQLGKGKAYRVCDPFCGVGTTLVECARAGHSSTGVELNPYAAMSARLKASARGIAIAEIRAYEQSLQDHWSRLSDDRGYPTHFRSRVPFFPGENLAQVNKILNWIDLLPAGLSRDLFRVALGAVIVSLSNYSYQPSLSTRIRSGRPPQPTADVLAIFRRRIASMVSDLEHVASEADWADAHVTVGSSLNGSWTVEDHSIDLIITSPPYLNNYHYVRNSRPHLFFLGLVHESSEVRSLQENNFGKYWQTVRSRETPRLSTSTTTLDMILEKLRRFPDETKRGYGGEGWAAYAIQYFNDASCSLERCYRSLVDDGEAYFVLGDSYLQGVYVPVHEIFSVLARLRGFSSSQVTVVRKRAGSSTVRSRRCTFDDEAPELREFVVHLRK